MAGNKKKSQNNNYNTPNLFGFLQNVMIRAIDKGQILLAGIVLIFMIMVFKINPQDLTDLIKSSGNFMLNYCAIGWLFAILAILGWYYQSRSIRKESTDEIRRLSEEKKILQEKLIDRKLRSSN